MYLEVYEFDLCLGMFITVEVSVCPSIHILE
jgi:hypothetical protein